MSISALRETVRRELLGFAWDQWAQLGLFARTERRDRAAADPEALLLFSLEVGRDDPRLFDEVLDWLLANQALISVQRLRNLCVDRDDHDLTEAALAWVSRWQPRARFASRPGRSDRSEPRPLFRASSSRVPNPDPAFAAVGLLKPDTEPSRKSRPPDLVAPIAFAFRMRLAFGVGSRAEVVRYLVVAPVQDVSVQQVAEAVAYAKRNVSDTLSALANAGLLLSQERGNERRYSLDRASWGQFLGLSTDTWPAHRDWPQVLRGLRRLRRWIDDPQLEDLTEYMLASRARDLMGEIEGDLARAGVTLSARSGPPGERYWDVFRDAVEKTLASLQSGEAGAATRREAIRRRPPSAGTGE